MTPTPEEYERIQLLNVLALIFPSSIEPAAQNPDGVVKELIVDLPMGHVVFPLYADEAAAIEGVETNQGRFNGGITPTIQKVRLLSGAKAFRSSYDTMVSRLEVLEAAEEHRRQHGSSEKAELQEALPEIKYNYSL